LATVVEINDLDRLSDYRLVWQALLGTTCRATFFQSLDWLQVYWRHYGQGQKLRVLVVYSGGQPIGILPLVVRAEWTRLGTTRLLTYPLHDWGCFYGPIGADVTATLLAGLGHIRRTPMDWDLIDLRWIDHEGTDHGRTAMALEAKGLPTESQVRSTSSLVSLTGTWDEYWASRTSKWRNNVRRSEKKLAERGKVEYVRYRPTGAAADDGNPRRDLLNAVLDIAGQSWQAASLTGTTLTHESVRAFLSDAHDVASRCGALDLNLLTLDGRPMAFNYAYQYHGQVYGLRTGFDAEDGDGAGSVLQYYMIRDCFARGDELYDLGIGYEDCKRYWRTHTSPVYQYIHYPRGSARMQLLRLRRRLGQRTA
jgi:CelD/BcsL family acetyltransferase involved in cellulose biosynthesis